MYKRPARILYLGPPDDRRTVIATRLTAEIGAGWVEGRGAPVHDVDAEALSWADLVIPLDAQSLQQCPPLPPTARLKPWDLPDGDSEEAETLIRAHIRSMLGGMRLLSRLDGKPKNPVHPVH